MDKEGSGAGRLGRWEPESAVGPWQARGRATVRGANGSAR